MSLRVAIVAAVGFAACAGARAAVTPVTAAAAPVAGSAQGEFTSNWNDLSLGDLFERMRISMPQNAPGSLSRQDNADILSYILNKGNYPAGKAELPTQTEVLNGVKFVAVKP